MKVWQRRRKSGSPPNNSVVRFATSMGCWVKFEGAGVRSYLMQGAWRTGKKFFR